MITYVVRETLRAVVEAFINHLPDASAPLLSSSTLAARFNDALREMLDAFQAEAEDKLWISGTSLSDRPSRSTRAQPRTWSCKRGTTTA